MVLVTKEWPTEQLMEIARRSWIVLFTIALITLIILWPMVGGAGLFLWAMALLILATAMAVLARHYAQNKPHSVKSTAHYARLHNLSVLLIGIIWGSGILLVRHDELAAILYIFVLSGTALGAVSAQHSYPPSCLTSIWSSITPVAFVLLIGGVTGLPASIGVLLIIFGITLSGVANKMNDFMAQREKLTLALNSKILRLSETSREIDQARKAAETANRAKSEILAQVSHDLRHPLHAIGLLANALSDAHSPEERQQIARQIDQAVGGLSRVFGLLLENERLERGETPVHLATVALQPLLEAVRAAVPQSENSPEIRHVPCNIFVKTDPRLLTVMVLNLLDNARKYAPKGRILLGCRRQGEQVAIWVSDQGPGVAEHDFDRLFEPFNRLHPKDLSAGEGAGLGLAITHKMAGLLGVKLRVMSQEGHGTTFMIEGLIAAHSSAGSETTMTRGDSPPLDGLNVTLLESTTPRQNELLALLSQWGCAVSQDPKSPADIILLGAIPKDTLTALSKHAETRDKISIIALDPQWTDGGLPHALSGHLVSQNCLKPFQLRSLLQSLAMP